MDALAGRGPRGRDGVSVNSRPSPPLAIGDPRDPHGIGEIAHEAGVDIDGPTLAPDQLVNGWRNAPVVFVVGHVTTELLARRANDLPRRDRVIVVVREPVPQEVWRRAVALGAEQVVVLPSARSWLLAQLTARHQRRGASS